MSAEDKSTMGMNRTGIGTSPIDSKELIEAANRGLPTSAGSAESLDRIRGEYAGAEPIGTVPVPSTLKGALKAMTELVRGHGPTVYLDKLGQRLAFERTGTRLYEGLLAKLATAPHLEGGPTHAELARFHDEELAHFDLVRSVIEELGADPTAMTPAADVIGTASMGLIQVVSDPRTTMSQALDALLTAELTDNDGWQMLADLARALGKDEHAARFTQALREEEAHLAAVRRWLSVSAVEQAKAAA